MMKSKTTKYTQILFELHKHGGDRKSEQATDEEKNARPLDSWNRRWRKNEQTRPKKVKMWEQINFIYL